MLKSLKSNSYRFVVVLLLLLTFLSTGVAGKVITSYALADPVIEYTQVYDTNIIQLSDYVDNTLTQSQGDIYYILLGLFVYSQGAVSDYTLIDPYANKSDVLSWLKSCGIQLHNTIIGFIPDNTIINVGNKAYNIGDIKPYLSGLVGYALGAATKASTYNTYQDFVDDVDNSDHWFMPYDQSLQIGVNIALGLHEGLYNWQHSRSPFTTTVAYNYPNFHGQSPDAYLQRLNSFTLPCRLNSTDSSYTGWRLDLTPYSEYHNIFVNTTNNMIYVCNDEGDNIWQAVDSLNVNPDGSTSFYLDGMNFYIVSSNIPYNPNSYNLVRDLIVDLYNGVIRANSSYFVFYEDFIEHVYFGPQWSARVEVFNDSDLNFYDVNPQYYLQVQNQYLLDIKGIINDLVNTLDLHTTLINNLYNDDGTLNIDPSFIKVSVDLPNISIETQRDPELPVNLNDIELYTDNEFLTVVKQRSLQASETIGEYVAFWHNCDPELVYAILGSFIIILIGAFIGKWGHS